MKIGVPTWKVRNTEPLIGVAQLESLVKLDGGETGLLLARFIQTPEIPSWASMTYLTVAVKKNYVKLFFVQFCLCPAIMNNEK